ncbi:hypothetical protein JNUCC1_01564 [Lentibacillus sp. JNUCC-1]|uniref:DUF2187 family protein n=1 Tax=Lentibacillus sp. JNUCC-1 TaxID=2654513 RepID=UPI001326EEA3|nr:hypothetical protein [Lentibacillus sp. JNUCC-1]
MFKPDQNKAHFGDIIEFEQAGVLVRGKVLPSNTKNSIMVDISDVKDYEDLNHGYTNTIVHHENYRVIETARD